MKTTTTTTTKKTTSKKTPEVKTPEVKTPEVKTPKLSMTERREEFMKTLTLTERFCFENAEVAVRPDDYAMLTQDNAVMIYLKSEDTASAKRVCEVWLHSRKANDFYINTRLFNQLCEKSEKFAELRKCINPKAKTSKTGLAIAEETDLTDWVNFFLTLI